MFKLEKAKEVGESIKTLLAESCERIEIAGSIRRQKAEVGDIELLCIPKLVDGEDQLERQVTDMVFKGILALRLSRNGRRTYGPLNKLMIDVKSGIGVDIFATTEECWAVALVVRTGGKKTNIEISNAAIKLGYKFHAYGSGFSTPWEDITCHSEAEVFKAVGLPYREPWERE